tara:strand:- start:42 stop:713 length:672 start_codon:yes stop_codon:yes gene_type:complete
MDAYKPSYLENLPKFNMEQSQLALVERKALSGSSEFFRKLMQTKFNIIGQVSRATSAADIRFLLEEDIPPKLQLDPFFELWVDDMANVCNVFCDVVGEDAIGFCLSTERGCRRYHIDNVPMRLLVTYAGEGTEWLPESASDREAFEGGMANEFILKDPSARQFVGLWDIAVFRGGPKGVLHRTPDSALNGPSILMRLDREDFWNNVLGQSQGNTALKALNEGT